MSIMQRLVFSLIVTVITLLLIAGGGLLQLGQAQSRFDYALDNTLPSMELLEQSKAALAEQRVVLHKAMMEKDPAKQATLEQQLTQAGTALDGLLSQYEKDLLSDEADRQLLGDTLYVNPMILGYAWQKGWVPLRRESLLRAMELNNVQVENNKTAFEWGRQAAHDRARVERLLAGAGGAQVIEFKKRETLESIIARRVEFLTGYQNAAYAQTYRDFVAKVQQEEAKLGKTALSEAVARYLFKLMAYKDEYEVARLHSDPAFLKRIDDMFEGDYTLNYHLAPPMTADRNEKGELIKKKYGPSMLRNFKLLAKLKGLRGGAFDVFGKTEERQTERALIQQYRASIEEVLRSLNADNHATAVEIARIPEQIKGYGHVKERNLKPARERWNALMAQYRDPAATAAQAQRVA